MHYSLAALIALASLSFVCAAPKPTPLSAQQTELVKRKLQSPVKGLPKCNTKDTDPTWADGDSAYKDGEGLKIGDSCDNGQHGKNKCWTDYFFVGTTEDYEPWYNAIGNIDCPSSGTCSQAIGKLSQGCRSFEWSVAEQVSTKAEFEFVAEIGASLTGTEGETKMACNTNTTLNTCLWDDDKCHSVWASQLVTTVHGYKRRTCKSPTDNEKANMPNAPKRDGDRYSRGMQDFAVKIPGINAISCDGECTSKYAGPKDLPTSPNGGQMQPWTGTK